MARSRRVPEAQKAMRAFLADASGALEHRAIKPFDLRVALALAWSVSLFDNVSDRVALRQLEVPFTHSHAAPSSNAQRVRLNKISRSLPKLSRATLLIVTDPEGGVRGTGKSVQVDFSAYLGEDEQVQRMRYTIPWVREAELLQQQRYTNQGERCSDSASIGVAPSPQSCSDSTTPTESFPNPGSEPLLARVQTRADDEPFPQAEQGHVTAAIADARHALGRKTA